MVRALLDTRKTQTRRLLKEQPGVSNAIHSGGRWQWRSWKTGCFLGDVRLSYAPGDRLYVRESCKPIPDSKPGGYFVPGSPFYGVEWFYRADGNCPLWADGKWRPSIHMPRSASRITLTVTEVRVQRLQEISEADVVAEGCAWSNRWEGYTPCPDAGDARYFSSRSAARSFEHLWSGIHGPDAWDANPWVVAVSFTVRKGNIDQETTP